MILNGMSFRSHPVTSTLKNFPAGPTLGSIPVGKIGMPPIFVRGYAGFTNPDGSLNPDNARKVISTWPNDRPIAFDAEPWFKDKRFVPDVNVRRQNQKYIIDTLLIIRELKPHLFNPRNPHLGLTLYDMPGLAWNADNAPSEKAAWEDAAMDFFQPMFGLPNGVGDLINFLSPSLYSRIANFDVWSRTVDDRVDLCKKIIRQLGWPTNARFRRLQDVQYSINGFHWMRWHAASGVTPQNSFMNGSEFRRRLDKILGRCHHCTLWEWDGYGLPPNYVYGEPCGWDENREWWQSMKDLVEISGSISLDIG